MNDDELTTMVRESFTGVHTTTPGGTDREPWPNGARPAADSRTGRSTAVAAAAALAVSSLLPAPTEAASPQPAAQLAAWTVTKQADGTIRVTIRELRDPAGLQSKLRADGVPASVTLIGQENPSCRDTRRAQGYCKGSSRAPLKSSRLPIKDLRPTCRTRR